MSQPCCGMHEHHHAEINTNPFDKPKGEGFLLTIPQLDCPTEEKQIRTLLADLPIKRLTFYLAEHQVWVQAKPALKPQVEKQLQDNGFHISANIAQRDYHFWQLGTAVGLALTAELIDYFTDAPWLAGLLALTAITLGGLRTYQLGWQAIKRGQLNVNSLMTVAVTGAFLIGQWAEAAMVMVLFTLADMVEARTVDKARNSIAGLLSLTPNQAILWRDGQWVPTDVTDIATGELIRIAPGERIPLDGIIKEGHSTIDEAAFTGESIPVEKASGDSVLAGTINVTGSLIITTAETAEDTALARMIAMVEDAQQQQSPIERWIDKFASIYTPVVFAMAIAAVVFLPLLTSHTLLSAIYSALVLLVIACPCALVLAAPVTIAAALTDSARHGVLVKGGAYLEQGRNISAVAFDKTGTLTKGKHTIKETVANHSEHLTLGGNLAYLSQHPVSQAIAASYAEDDKQQIFTQVDDHVGGGISGVYNQQRYYLGNFPWLETVTEHSEFWRDTVQTMEQKGYSVTLLANEQEILALFALADELRPSAQQSLAYLHEHGIKTLLLTGDNANSAAMIANQVGIKQVFHRQTPEQKTEHLRSLKTKGHHVAMVGDGINDGLALASADVGISLGQAGTDVAREAADVMLMDNSLAKLPYFFELSKRTHKIVMQNISLAVGIKVIILILALFGLSNMWMAVLADVGVSLLVVANGIRALRMPSSTLNNLGLKRAN